MYMGNIGTIASQRREYNAMCEIKPPNSERTEEL
jgi:hypothetical protein